MQAYGVEKVIDQEPSPISQLAAQQVADTYLQTEIVGEIVGGLTTTSPILIPGDPPIWRMLIRFCSQETATTVSTKVGTTVGTIDVNAQTGSVIRFTTEQIEDLRDRIQAHTGVAKDGEAKAVVRPLAQMQANGYLTNYVSLFAQADRPIWVPGNPPRWRATVCLRLRGHGRICELGTIDVDANTGTVIPLTADQLHTMRKCVQDAATRSAPTTATTR